MRPRPETRNLRVGVEAITRALLFAFAVACSVPQEAPPERPSRVSPPTPHEATAHAPFEPPPSLDPTTVCGRALACCRAFARATPHVSATSACAETFEVAELEDADARCGRMQLGWRAALEVREDLEPPEACSASTE